MIYLIFSADEAFEGAPVILDALAKHQAKASFFLTGNCLRTPLYMPVIRRIIKDGHYVGGHSDNHLLYAPWDDRSRLLVSPDSLLIDLSLNIRELNKFGIEMKEGDFYLPPYEWYNKRSVNLVEQAGLVTINYTPGISTAADYTTPDMKNYRSSQTLIDRLYDFERQNTLNGAIILIHPGTHPDRTDKLYNRLDEIIARLKHKGYEFDSLSE